MQTPSLKQLSIAAALLLVLSGATLHGIFANGYAFDAIHTVRDNPLVQPSSPVTRIFQSPYWDPEQYPDRGLYRPVATASFWLTRSLFGAHALTADHIVDLALHVANGLLVFALLVTMRAGHPTALLLSALYSVHPVHSEVVASLVGRCDLLATFFALSALHVALLRPPGRGGLAAQSAALFVLCSASLLSKESAVTMFLLIPLCACFHSGRDWRSLASRGSALAAPLLAALALNLVVRQSILGDILIGETAELAPGAGWLAERWSALAYLTLYVEKTVWPHPLLPDYGTGVIPAGGVAFHARAALGLAFALGSAVWIGTSVIRKRSLDVPRLGLLLFWIAIAPVCNLVIPIGTHFAERLLYFPLAFLPLLALHPKLCRIEASDRFELRPAIAASLVVIIALFATLDTRRIPEWRDNRSLFAAAIRDTPGNYHSLMSYGTTLLEDGTPEEHPEVWRAFSAAAQLREQAYEPWAGLGKLALEMGHPDQARAAFERALARAGPHERHLAAMNLARTHRLLEDESTARALLSAIVEAKPDFVPAHRELGDLDSNRGDVTGALIHYQQAHARQPTSVDLCRRVIWAHLHLGQGEAARRIRAACPPDTVSDRFEERLAREGITLAELR